MPAERTRSIRLTQGGWTLLLLGILLALGAFNAALNMTYLLASLVLAVFLVSLVLPFWSLHGLECRRSIHQPPFADEPFEVQLTLSSKRGSTARLVAVEEPLGAPADDGTKPARKLALTIPGRGRVRFSCTAEPLKRGVHKLPELRWTSGFPFGVAECAVRKRSDEALVVYPARGQLGSVICASLRPRGMRLGARTRSGSPGDEFRSVREYHDGDNPRHIHWRASARLNKLYVREMERERSSPIMLLVDSRVPASTEPGEKESTAEALELAVSFAAEVCRVALESGAPVHLVGFFPEPEVVTAEPRPGAIRKVRDALARLSPSEAEDAHDLAEVAGTFRVGSAWRAIAVTPTPATAIGLQEGFDMRHLQMYVASEAGFSDIFRLTRSGGKERA